VHIKSKFDSRKQINRVQSGSWQAVVLDLDYTAIKTMMWATGKGEGYQRYVFIDTGQNAV